MYASGGKGGRAGEINFLLLDVIQYDAIFFFLKIFGRCFAWLAYGLVSFVLCAYACCCAVVFYFLFLIKAKQECLNLLHWIGVNWLLPILCRHPPYTTRIFFGDSG